MPNGRRSRAKAVVPSVVTTISASPFEPARLDPILEDAKKTLEDAIATWNDLQPFIGEFRARFLEEVKLQRDGQLTAEQAHAIMQSLTSLMERQARTVLTVAKSTDLVARLRVHLAGGVPETPDLVGKSDRELEQIIRAAAGALGMGTDAVSV